MYLRVLYVYLPTFQFPIVVAVVVVAPYCGVSFLCFSLFFWFCFDVDEPKEWAAALSLQVITICRAHIHNLRVSSSSSLRPWLGVPLPVVSLFNII